MKELILTIRVDGRGGGGDVYKVPVRQSYRCFLFRLFVRQEEEEEEEEGEEVTLLSPPSLVV